ETQSQDWVFCYLELIESQILITAYRLFLCSSSTKFNHSRLSEPYIAIATSSNKKADALASARIVLCD
ncbi:hypothetical protein, partial [Vibrio cholerae]|uniref:hypothetical protein n=1 Tax=Vibrio cholerae TaxID=666 RepID=UPI00226F82E1